MKGLGLNAVAFGAIVTVFVCTASGCADGGTDGGPGRRRDASIDTGPVGLDATARDSGATDAGRGSAMTCEACIADGDCALGFYCAPLGSGDHACLPACGRDLPECSRGFECAPLLTTPIPDPVCAPVGERCCVDEDGDLYGSGIGCLGIDCNESDTDINASGTETCDGVDEDCDGEIDEGNPAALCPHGTHVAGTACTDGECVISACEPTYDDCDDDIADGCEREIDTATDCGSCDANCSLPHVASAGCNLGACTVVDCEEGWGDCNARAEDGCETELVTTTHCGACGQTCSLGNATSTCETGRCEIDACDPDWGDCDARDSNGCETPLTTNADCGSCDVLCSPTSGNGDCSTGMCRVTTCSAGYEDCDMSAANGCETSIRSLATCGACGVPCEFANGSASCAAGACTLVSCDTGHANCDGTNGNGCETPTNTLTNCGACGVPCAPANAVGECGTGTCRVVTCNPGFENCDGNDANGCETPLNTLTSCGGCGVTCSLPNAGESCATGTCEITSCNLGFADCDMNPANGCETPLNSVDNCGACGNICAPSNAVGACATGVCAVAMCAAGFGDCDSSAANGCERSLRTTSDCGGCGVSCTRGNATATCSTGTCGIGSCNGGFGNCDGNDANGCEAPLNTLSNCGGCGLSCSRGNATATCSTGSCRIQSCNGGWGNCDSSDPNGCESGLNSLTNCGGCGIGCNLANGSESCSSGSCQLTGCDSGFSNCDGNGGNGCERNHRAVARSCNDADDVGTYDGDTSCGFICGGNGSWDLFGSRSGTSSAWFRARAREDSSCSADVEHEIRLNVPGGVNYDLFVYRGCGNEVGRSTNGSGAGDTVRVREGESSSSDDAFDYWVEVRWVSGAACGEWTLEFFGHDC